MASRLHAFRHALAGITCCIRTETHARFHLAASALVVCAAIVLGAGLDDWCWFVICIGFVVSAELINTSIERLSDHASPEFHPLIGDAKDVAAGAVLVASIASGIIGVLRFWPLLLKAMA